MERESIARGIGSCKNVQNVRINLNPGATSLPH